MPRHLASHDLGSPRGRGEVDGDQNRISGLGVLASEDALQSFARAPNLPERVADGRGPVDPREQGPAPETRRIGEGDLGGGGRDFHRRRSQLRPRPLGGVVDERLNAEKDG